MTRLFAFLTPLIITGFLVIMPVQAQQTEVAVFAGGCFWCLEADFDKLDGVLSTTSGYTGGTIDNPTYEQVSIGGTGHYEVVKVVFYPKKISYKALTDYFWRHIDPVDAKGQFCDKGDQYRAAVFYENEGQRELAFASKAHAEMALGKAIVTQIIKAGPFYNAEDYHQDYYWKNPLKYNYYRWRCGRNSRVADIWGNIKHP